MERSNRSPGISIQSPQTVRFLRCAGSPPGKHQPRPRGLAFERWRGWGGPGESSGPTGAGRPFARGIPAQRHPLRREPHGRPQHLVALGGAANVLSMMSANLVGFSIGVAGVQMMWRELLGSWAGLQVLAAILVVVFCAVQVMIEYRAAEAREGIQRKC
ncbi:hypothetical protein PtB15_2B250 [Puccinia triticina]|nr:hypothetical protein PtB15_2B250 [Puccinia triticina]